MRRSRRLSPEEEAKVAASGAHVIRSDRDARTEMLMRLQRAAGNASVSAMIEEEGGSAAASVKQVLGSETGRPLDDTTRGLAMTSVESRFTRIRKHHSRPPRLMPLPTRSETRLSSERACRRTRTPGNVPWLTS